MQNLYDALNEYSPLVTIALIVAVAVIFVMVVIITYILSKTHERMYRFFGGRTRRRSMETMLDEYLSKVSRVESKYNELLALVDDINFRLVTCVRKVGVVRYNPFESMGGDQSFALALLDENDDGIVISTIHARDASYTYAKQILGGNSSHTLTDEELEAIKVALDWKPIVNMGAHKLKRDKRLADLKNRQRNLSKQHEANAPEPSEPIQKVRKVSRAKAKVKASRKKIFSKAVPSDVKSAIETVSQWHGDETTVEAVSKPLAHDASQNEASSTGATLEVAVGNESEASPVLQESRESIADKHEVQPDVSKEELDEIMENMLAIERFQQKLLRHQQEVQKNPSEEF